MYKERTAMSARSAHPPRNNGVFAVCVLALSLGCALSVIAQGISPTSSKELYLVSGTTTVHSPEAYPLVLYTVGIGKILHFVREVVPQAQGVRYIYAWGDAIFALYPHDLTTTAAVIHTGDPMRVDNVVFSPDGVNPSPIATVVTAPKGASEGLLLPLVTNFNNFPNVKVSLAAISTDLAGTAPRVTFEKWDEYAALRWEGSTGGPEYGTDIVGSIKGDDIVVDVFGHSAIVDELPPELRSTTKKIVPVIIAANQEYFLSYAQRSKEELDSGILGDSRELFVHDRLQNRWGAIHGEGNSSTMRLFGPWLATIVKNWDPKHGLPPGRTSERAQEESTPLLPPVQILYRSFAGHYDLIPGILTLQNLADGRKIRIETNQEDSEILWVAMDTVLYRVNDTIYQATLIGDKLQAPLVLVKDEHVPEIHWVFWSK